MTDPDYAALAVQAEAAHRDANERYGQAQADSYDAAFRELVFTAAAAGALTVVLEPSDQGEHMTINEVTLPEDSDVDENDIENDLYDGAADLPDYETATWTILPGVTVDESMGGGIHTATIDITVAAPAAFEALQQEWLAKAPEGVTLPNSESLILAACEAETDDAAEALLLAACEADD